LGIRCAIWDTATKLVWTRLPERPTSTNLPDCIPVTKWVAIRWDYYHSFTAPVLHTVWPRSSRYNKNQHILSCKIFLSLARPAYTLSFRTVRFIFNGIILDYINVYRNKRRVNPVHCARVVQTFALAHYIPQYNPLIHRDELVNMTIYTLKL